MNYFEFPVIAAITGTLLVSLVYLYMYVQFRERYIGIWVISWAIYLFRLILFDMFSLVQIVPQAALIYQLLSVCNGLALIVGTYEFIGKRIPKEWFYGALIVTGLSDLFLFYWKFSLFFFALPTACFLGSASIWTGIAFMRKVNIGGIGKYTVGFAFVLLGVHDFDFPFLITEVWFVPWGYLADAFLRFVIAMGTMFMYFEKTRLDLVHKEKYYRLLAENAVDVIFRYKFVPLSGFEYISPAVTEFTGYSPEEYYADFNLALGVVHPDDRKLVKAFFRSGVISHKPLIFRFNRKGQTWIWVELRGAPIYDTMGNLAAFEGIIRDITERRRLEQDISRLDGLHAVGEMAANIAHEIRNPMTTIRGYLQLLGSKKEFFNYREQFELLLHELDRTNCIITEYLSLSKQKYAELRTCQLNKIIEALHPLIQADANASSKDVVLVLGNIPELNLDDKEIRQLILNLARNGLEAMSPGGTLTLRTVSDRDGVVFAVEDQGKGILPHVLEKLGTPFMTSKENGTGLGLPVCYRIVERHRAAIRVETGDRGTTFFVHFK
jgi:two-component system, sporulation sensor kinase C